MLRAPPLLLCTADPASLLPSLQLFFLSPKWFLKILLLPFLQSMAVSGQMSFQYLPLFSSSSWSSSCTFPGVLYPHLHTQRARPPDLSPPYRSPTRVIPISACLMTYTAQGATIHTRPHSFLVNWSLLLTVSFTPRTALPFFLTWDLSSLCQLLPYNL